jgi:hypothetical protein
MKLHTDEIVFSAATFYPTGSPTNPVSGTYIQPTSPGSPGQFAINPTDNRGVGSGPGTLLGPSGEGYVVIEAPGKSPIQATLKTDPTNPAKPATVQPDTKNAGKTHVQQGEDWIFTQMMGFCRRE